jgi:uncharacterized membrane protein
MMWDWEGFAWWCWFLMIAGMVTFWLVVVWVLLAAVRSAPQRRTQAEETLARRFALGEIDAGAYEHCLDALCRGTHDRSL